MDTELKVEIERLKMAPMRQLKARYQELFGEPSRSFNRAHLWRRVAWRLQARQQGSLSERARQRAMELADDADLRVRAPAAFWQELATAPAGVTGAGRDPRLPAAGTVLERVYRDRTIVVQVLASSFEYEGQSYGSLSAIAHRATGTCWNGFTFFGLSGAQRRG
jgi:hypothetical protein